MQVEDHLDRVEDRVDVVECQSKWSKLSKFGSKWSKRGSKLSKFWSKLSKLRSRTGLSTGSRRVYWSRLVENGSRGRVFREYNQSRRVGMNWHEFPVETGGNGRDFTKKHCRSRYKMTGRSFCKLFSTRPVSTTRPVIVCKNARPVSTPRPGP